MRVSGEQSLEILNNIFSKQLTDIKPNTIHYGTIRDDGEMVDEVLVSVFHEPHSYTGENAAEISCHGSPYILNKVLQLLIRNGCRMAEPGEFTKRAYLNGKMDLSQAEAVADVIAASNQATHRIAVSQMRGGVSTQLEILREKLLKLTSLLELELDFSDHEDLEFADRNELQTLAHNIQKHIAQLAQSFKTGQALKTGVPVAIVGNTNVGKSTLLNALLKEDRAIVSNIHGTTRDTIEDTIDINGVTFRFIDTAGIRQTTDEVEQIGIKKTLQTIERARIILWVNDSMPDKQAIAEMQKKCHDKKLIIILNKIDLQKENTNTTEQEHIERISAKTGKGIKELENKIYQASGIQQFTANDIIITSARHFEALSRALKSTERVTTGLKNGLSGDLIAEDLRIVLAELGEITGKEITPQATLNNIFKHFCVGK